MRNIIRTSIAVALLATVATGCRARGIGEQATQDFTVYNTKAGEVFPYGEGHAIRVVSITRNFETAPPSVDLVVKNEGPPAPLLSFDLEFGFPAPSDSFAPYIPDFVSVDLEEVGAGEERTVNVESTTGQTGVPHFARVSVPTGDQVRQTTGREASEKGVRPGTVLLGGKVEVVGMKADINGGKPMLAFTIENVDRKNPDEELGNLRYMVQFYKKGELLDLGRRFSTFKALPEKLGKAGSSVTFEVAGMDDQEGLGGAMPVLRILK